VPLLPSKQVLGRLLEQWSINCRQNWYCSVLLVLQYPSLLTMVTAKAMAAAIIGSRCYYCNSVLYGMSQVNINRQQHVQNILARVVARAPWTVSSLDIDDTIFIGCLLATALLLNSVYSHGKHSTLPILLTCPNSSPTTFHPEPYVLPTQIFWPDLPASLVGHSLFPHRLPGSHCLHTSAL